VRPATGGRLRPAAFLLPIGLGAGNIGDELINRTLWQRLPAGVSLAVPLFGQGPPQREAYPGRHRYLPAGAMPQGPAMLAGGTISDSEGVHFPLRFLAPQLRRCHRSGWWVEAHGVGVDPIKTAEGREIFREAFLPLRKWTVRSAGCRDALLELGVADERIVVAADWAWLYEPDGDYREWARKAWREWGRDERMPLAVLNVVEPWEGLAGAIESLSETHQVAFYSNDSRAGAPDQRVVESLNWKGLRAPPESYSPGEAIALLAAADVVAAQRYHTVVEAALGGARLVLLARPGRKIHSLGVELRIEVAERAADIPQMIASAQPMDATVLIDRAARLVRELPALPRKKAGQGHALVVHMGGLGDLVLAAGFLAALRRRFAKVTLLCRQPVAGIVGLMPEGPHQVLALGFNPYREVAPSALLEAELRRLGQLGTPDVLVSAEYKPTWLGWYLASLLEVGDSFQAQPTPAPHGLLTVLLHRQQLDRRDLAAPPPARYAHERERYGALARWLGAPVRRLIWNKPAPVDGLAPGSYIACFPGGAAHLPEKTWGASRFREVLESAGSPVVVVGDAGDRDHLEAAAPAGARIVVGDPERIGEIAALVANARAWVGNDSGLSHLAQAYGVAGVVPFGGGGGWPVYGVWGRGSIGLVCELGCFGCEWACAFTQNYCLREIPVNRVAAALRHVTHHPNSAPQTWRLSPRPELSQQIVAGAAEKHRALRLELAHRMDALVELEHGRMVSLEHALAESQAVADTLPQLRQEADTMRQAAQERLALVERADRENEALRSALEERGRALADAAAEAAYLGQEAANRLHLLEEARQEIGQLRTTAEQRLALIEEAHEEMAMVQRVAAERLSALEAAKALKTERTDTGMETMKDLDRTRQG